MKVVRAIVAILAAPILLAAAAPLRVESGHTTSVTVGSAMSAFAIDRAIVDVTLADGVVTIVGRAAGATQVIVIGANSQQSFSVEVVAARARTAMAARKNAPSSGQAAISYSSGARQVQSQVTLQGTDGQRSSKIEVQTVAGTSQRGGHEVATPAVSWQLRSGKRSLTLFDGAVASTPLTLDGVTVRGVHLDDGRWELHAGATSFATFQAFLLPTDRELVFGAARRFDVGHGTLTPSLYFFPTKNGSGRDGSVASLAHAFDSDRIDARTEVAYSNGHVGASALFSLRDPHREADLDAVIRPRGFAGAGPAAMHGTFASAAWRERHGAFESDVSASMIRYDEVRNHQSLLTGTGELRYRVRPSLQLISGATWARYGDGAGVRSLTVPLGVQADFRRASLGATMRYATNSSTNDGGLGFRVNGRLSFGRVYTSAYVDVQESAPTLSLIYQEQPELMSALEELGIRATTPGDIARALRDNAALLELGFVDNVNIELAPRRVQAGWEIAWFGATASRRQLRLRFLLNRVEGISRDVATQAATLTYSQRITAATDVQASVSQWRIARTGMADEVMPSVEIGLRHTFDGVPELFGAMRTGTISGTVFLDDDVTGDPQLGKPLAGAEVELDGTKRVVTGADGRYAFPRVSQGSHRLVARTPKLTDAYFTTPSHIEVAAGDSAHFGIAVTPARLFGTVMSDASVGVGGVTLVLTRGARTLNVTSASNGSFEVAAAPGEWSIAIASDTLPSGFSISGQPMQSVMLARNAPQHVTLALHANRSISGRVAAASNATVTLEGSGRSVTTDAEGRYVFRGVGAGPVTLIATAGPASWQRTLEIPAAPAVIRDVDFGTPAVHPINIASTIEPASTAAGREVASLNTFIVQLGAYHVSANAEETAARARSAGIDAEIVASSNLLIVRVGPFHSSAAASAIVGRLQQAGVDAVVLHAR